MPRDPQPQIPPGAAAEHGEAGAPARAPARDPERERLLKALESRERLYRLLADNSTDLIALHRTDGTYVYVSPSVERLLGFGRLELLGRRPWEFVHPDHRDRVRACWQAASRGEAADVEYRIESGSGEYIWFETLAQPIVAGTDVAQIESTSRDITERKSLERQLAFRALHDPLTGLPNRTLFMDRLQHRTAVAERTPRPFGILFIDLDRFKQVNDTLGHAAGDALLVKIGRRIAKCVREMDTVARLGGDEFAILVEDVSDASELTALAARIVNATRRPIRVERDRIEARLSVGIAMSPTGTDRPHDLMRQADSAMYRAKRSRDRGYRLFGGGRGRR